MDNIDQALSYLIFNAAQVVAMVIAAVLAYQQKEGWGWFLFIALLIGVSFKTVSN